MNNTNIEDSNIAKNKLAIIQTKNLCKEFVNKNKVTTRVLDNIDFEIKQSECISLIGSSGSGKSTFLRCLNLLETPTSGDIVFCGKTLDSKSKDIDAQRQKIGFVFQNFNLFANMNVLKNITLAPKLYAKRDIKNNNQSNTQSTQSTQYTQDKQINGNQNIQSIQDIQGLQGVQTKHGIQKTKKQIEQEIEERAMSLLDRFAIKDKALNYPTQLSGGQKQRVAIVRALMCNPQIMLFDEPTSALDPEMVKEVLACIEQLKIQGMIMIVVTHEMKFAKAISTKVAFLHKGKIEEQGTPQQIFDQPTTPRLQEFLSKLL